MQASRFRLYSKGLTRRRCLGCRTVVARWYTLCGQLPVARPARPSAPRLFGVSAPQFGVGASQAWGVVGSRVTQKLLRERDAAASASAARRRACVDSFCLRRQPSANGAHA